MAEDLEEQLKAQIIDNGADPKSDSAWYKIGVTQTEPEAKLFAFQKAVKISKKNSDAWIGIGLLLKDPVEKEEAFRNAIKADPKFADAYYNLGLILPDPKEKVKMFQKIIQMNQQYGNAYVELAKLTKDRKQKLALLSEALQNDPTNENVYIATADLYDETSEKLQILRKGIDQCPPSKNLWTKLAFLTTDEKMQLQAVKKALELDTSNMQLWELIIRRAMKDDEVKEWATSLAANLEQEIRDKASDTIKNILTSRPFWKLIEEVFALAPGASKKAAEAEEPSGPRTKEQIEQALLKKMGEMGFPTYVGRSWISLADIITAPEEKVVALERGLGIDPSMNDGWTKLGYAYTDPEQKKTAFQRAVGINPQDILAWKGVAGVLTSLPEQIFCYQRVLEVNPQDGDALNFLIQAGIPLEDIGVQLSEAGVGEKPAEPSESMPEIEIPRNLPKPSYDFPESSSAEPEFEIPKNLPKPSYALPGKKPGPSATATEDDFKRVPVDASDLQVKEILEIVQEEHKLYFEEVAEKIGTPINNLKTFFKELLEEGKITGEFAVTGVSFNFDEGEQTLSLDNLKLAFATERGKATQRGKAASQKKDLEKIAASAPKEEVAAVDNYDTKRESKSVPYARIRYDREVGLAYIEGDKEQPYKTALNDTCPDCHKRIFEFEAFCRWCGSKLGDKVLVRSATGVTLPNSEAYPKEELLKQGPVDEMGEPALNEYPAIIIIRAKGVKMKEFFNNMEMTVPGMLHYEDMKAKELQKFYKSNGWDAPKMLDFPEEKGVLWLLVVGKAIGKKDFEDAWGRYCEAVPGLKVLRIDFLNTDEIKMHEWRAKYK